MKIRINPRAKMLVDEAINSPDTKTLIARFAEEPLTGKKLTDTNCPHCGIPGYLWIMSQEVIDDTKSIVNVECENCGKGSRLEIEVSPCA